jgi:hypothetical protein
MPRCITQVQIGSSTPLLISALRKGRDIYFTNLAAKNLNITLAENFVS